MGFLKKRERWGEEAAGIKEREKRAENKDVMLKKRIRNINWYKPDFVG